MGLRRRYVLHVCLDCGEPYPYAGSCDSCGSRLQQQAMIPVATIKEFQVLAAEASSPVPAVLNGEFVEKLLKFSKRSSS